MMTVKDFLKHFGMNSFEEAADRIKETLLKTKTITVHNGAFHEDDVKATALALIYAERVLTINAGEIKINRSRSNLVGLIMDVGEGFLDHHNREIFAEYEDGIRYAAAGLLYEYIGRELMPSDEEFLRLKRLVFIPGDAADNGDFSMLGIMPTFASTLNSASNPASRNDYFMKAVEMYKSYLEASIDIAWTKHKDKEYVQKCANEAIATGKKYIFFDRACEADFSFLIGLGIKFVATPNDESDTDDKFEAISLRCEEREFFPEIINGNHVWGLRKEELSNASDIPGMEFIHKDGFFATTKTRSAMQALLDLV